MVLVYFRDVGEGKALGKVRLAKVRSHNQFSISKTKTTSVKHISS